MGFSTHLGRARHQLGDTSSPPRPPSILAFKTSEITVWGSGFNDPLGDIAAISGTPTGTLADGMALNIDFGRASRATITLVPEPTTALLLAFGLVGLAAGRRPRGL